MYGLTRIIKRPQTGCREELIHHVKLSLFNITFNTQIVVYIPDKIETYPQTRNIADRVKGTRPSSFLK